MNHGLSAITVAKIHGVLSRHAEVEAASSTDRGRRGTTGTVRTLI